MPDDIPANETNVRKVHRVLRIGAFMVTGVLIAVVAVMGAPFLGRGSSMGIFQYGIGGAALAEVLVAVLVFRPRVQPRRPDQPTNEYWKDEAHAQAALWLWLLLVSAAGFGAVGYILAGGLVPILAAVTAVGFLSWYSPDRLAHS